MSEPGVPGESPESDQESHQTPPLFYQPAKPSGKCAAKIPFLSLPCNEHELGQTLGDGEGQGSLACCGPWGHKESDATGRLNNNISSKIRVFVVERLLHHKEKERGPHFLKNFFLYALFLVFIEFVKIWLLFYVLVSFFHFFFFLLFWPRVM